MSFEKQKERTSNGKEHFKNEVEFKKYLSTHGVSVHLWGKGDSKSVGDLLKEIRNGEAELQETADNKLIRLLYTVRIDIECVDPKTKVRYRLVEKEQKFLDGRSIQRKYPGSIGEKIKRDETIEQAFRRALKEELPTVSGPFKSVVSKGRPAIEGRVAGRYPGLRTTSHVYE